MYLLRGDQLKILFLDVDGVLNNMPGSWQKQPNSGTFVIDEDNLDCLRTIVGKTNPTIVMSSTWAMHDDHMDYLFTRAPFIKSRLHKDWRTPRKMSSTRGQEIAWWLEEHPETTSWCVLDDAWDSWLSDNQLNVVTTAFNLGLTEDSVAKAIQILGEK